MQTPRTTSRAPIGNEPSGNSKSSKRVRPVRHWPSRPNSTWPTPTTNPTSDPQALATVERFIKLHPGSPALDYAYYLQGLINFNEDLGFMSRWSRVDLSERDQQASRDAYQSFRQLIDVFPKSKYAEDARLRMNYIINSLAAYEVHVSRYYFLRGAYVAAANRAQQAVQEFPSAPASEEALYLMMSSYDKLGIPALKDDAERVLKRNFPQSSFLTGGVQIREKRWWHLW